MSAGRFGRRAQDAARATTGAHPGQKEEPGDRCFTAPRASFGFFNLRDLSDLPTLREYYELNDENKARVRARIPKAGWKGWVAAAASGLPATGGSEGPQQITLPQTGAEEAPNLPRARPATNCADRWAGNTAIRTRAESTHRTD